MILVRLGLLILFLFLLPINGQTIVLSSIADVAQCTALVAHPFILTECAFTSDIVMRPEEFYYLTEFKVGRPVTREQLTQAMTHLLQKNCFESITVSLEDEPSGKKLTVALKGLWRFEKLKVSGIWVGRDWYKQYYLMEPGDPFDQDKHEHSLQKMIEACKKEGFFNVAIQSSFDRKIGTKAVTVRVVIDRGRRFSLEDSVLQLHAEGDMPSNDVALLKEQLSKKFLRAPRIGKYSRPQLEQIAKSVKDYLAQRGFLLVTIDLTEQIFHAKNSVRITWDITLGKKRDFVFFGARFFSHKQLLQRILQFGRSAWLVPASILAEELKNMYHAKGFWQVKIDTSDDAYRALFVVTEGLRTRIDDIEIQGASQLSFDAVLKHCFNKFKPPVFFDQQLYDDAVEKMVEYYNAHGFLDAKLIQHDYVLEKDAHYRLLLTIEEGEQLWADTIAIPGFDHLLNHPPFYRKQKGARYNALQIQEQKRWLSDYFRKQGYLFASVTMEIVDMPAHKKHLIWHITLGQQVRFGKTVIQGCLTFPLPLLMQELAYKKGDIWDPQKVRQSFLRLKDKQIFDTVSFAPFSVAADKAERPLMLKIHPDDPFEVRLRAGLEFQHIRHYQTFGGLTYKIGGTFLVKNPSNRGDYFRFDGDVAHSHREVQLTYFYPHLFNGPVDALLQGYGIRYEQPGFVGNQNDIYTIFQEGARVEIRHKEQHLDGGINVGFEVDRTKVGSDSNSKESAIALAKAIDFNPRLLNKQIPFVCVEPTLLINHLDNNLNPTKGMLTLVSLKGMFPTTEHYAHSYFFKLLVEHSWFVVWAKVVAAFRVRFGHIFHRCFADILPNERFYLGGSHSVRSYDADLVPPLGCFIDKHGKKNIVPRGGKTMLNINIELRLPEWKKIGLVLFSDMGVLSGDNFIDFEHQHFVGGTGVGIRYFTPIGPLRFDIAWKWKKEAAHERRFNWYLTFGQAF